MGHPAIDRILRDVVGPAWKPPPRLSVSDWAGRYRYLSPEASAEPGLWRNARAPHLVEPMERLSPYSDTERVVMKLSSQTGKTEAILNFIGYIIDLDPGPILAIQPNVSPMGEAFSKDRVAPMLRDSPTLLAKVGQARSRSSASTITHKVFTGGHLTIAGANSPAGLASRPIRYLVCDEIDRWEITKEGDPLLLARKRLQTFRARRAAKELIVSSPTYADLGVCAEYDRCSQRYEWHLVCQHCERTQFPRLKHFHSDDGKPETVRYLCEHCGAVHPLAQADRVKASGRWVCVHDAGPMSAGYWMNQWASPFARWDDTLAEWSAAGEDPARRQAVTNTVFAEAWEGEGDLIEPVALIQRAEDWGDTVPAGVRLITIGVDVQGDRLELEVVGFGAGWESWSIAYDVLIGDPTSGGVWEDLSAYIAQPWDTADGRVMQPTIICIDSGAYTQHVYDFVKRSKDQRVIPVKGDDGMRRDAIAGSRIDRRRRAAKRLRDGRPPEILGVDGIKLTLYHYLRAAPGHVGYCHFPRGRDGEWYAQLTGERLVTERTRGRRPERRWIKVYTAVEALDCRVYAMAGALLSGIELGQQQPIVTEKQSPKKERKTTKKASVKEVDAPTQTTEVEPRPTVSRKPVRRGGNWVGRWR